MAGLLGWEMIYASLEDESNKSIDAFLIGSVSFGDFEKRFQICFSTPNTIPLSPRRRNSSSLRS